MMRKFNKQELFDTIDKLSIKKEISNDNNNLIVTRFGSKIIKSVGVSDIYEIFDFPTYVKNMVNEIVDTFNINFYDLKIKGGLQELRLFSDLVKISGKKFYKAIYILNSSDRTRKLNFDFGLYSKGDYISVISKDSSLRRKHVTGIREKVAQTIILDVDGFNGLIDTLKDIENKSIKMSKVQEVVLGKDLNDVKPTDILKLDGLKRNMMVNMKGFTSDESTMLKYKSENFKFDGKNDFVVDAFAVVENYLRIFRERDSYTIKRETTKILNVTKEVIRSRNLELLLG